MEQSSNARRSGSPSGPSRVTIVPLSVEAPLATTASRPEKQVPQQQSASLKNRCRKGKSPSFGSSKGKVSFSDTVFDLATGQREPLHHRQNCREMESQWKSYAPVGHRVIEKIIRGGKGLSLKENRALVWVLTFLCYMAYHASRKPPSIVKSVLHGSMTMEDGSNTHQRRLMEIVGGPLMDEVGRHHHQHDNSSTTDSSGWAPFNNPDNGNALLGDLDVSFLGAYALGMFISGHLGDRLDLRKFLTWGMLGSGACVALFGGAFFLNIHSMPYFLTIQVIGGFFQATGWPSVVTVMANWFGHGKRGLIMGVWNAHTSVGNILGSLIAASMLQYGWGWSFIIPGVLIVGIGLLIHLFLVVEPQDIGFLPQSGSNMGSLAASEVGTPRHPEGSSQHLSIGDKNKLERRLAIIAETHDGMVPSQVTQSMEAHHHIRRPGHGMIAMGSTLVVMNDDRDSIDGSDDEEHALLGTGQSSRAEREKSVSFLAAWCLPGVALYAFTLFFAKLVAYTFLYWLPYYISSTEVGGQSLTAAEAGKLSILFDVGGVVGGIAAGFLSDASSSPAIVSCSFVYLAIPTLYLYREYGSVSFPVNIGLMMMAGFFVNGPYALITTAVSADLGSSESVKGAKALATVTAIIDGMGSIGAALGPMATGYISELEGGFDNVFTMLYTAALSAGLLLSSLVFRELGSLLKKKSDIALPVEDSARLRREDVFNSSSFSYMPPAESGQVNIIIDNETGIKQSRS